MLNPDDYILEELTGQDDLEPLKFDHTEYTPLEQLVEHIHRLPSKRARVSTKSLSVNGKVVADKMEKYLANPAESSSLLKEVLKSPRHYYLARSNELPKKDAEYFELGTFIHSAVLEPKLFDKVILAPDLKLNSTKDCVSMIRFYWELLGLPEDITVYEWKIGELREEINRLNTLAKNEGFTFVKPLHQQIINVVRIGIKTYGNGIIPRLMNIVRPEISMYGTDSSTGLKVKIRPDGLLLKEDFGINAILSVKTTSATSVDMFLRDCAKYRYELAEGMYLQVASEVTGRKFSGTLMLMVQNVAPFQVALLYWDAEDLQVGKYKYQHALSIVSECRKTKYFPGFDALAGEGCFGIIQAKLPDYIKKELPPQCVND